MPKKILVVEDDSRNMKLLQMILRPHGYTFLKAADGEEALEVTIKYNPDLIITDILLPKMSGLEVTRRLRQLPAFSHVPIIAITAYAMRGDKEKVIDAGCDAYLSKPINTRELPEVVARILSERDKDTS